MNSKFFYFCVSVILISCTTKQTQKDLLINGANYTIDLDGKKETSIPLSSLFKNVRTIILETGDDCLIGNINELQVFDGYIYILDSRKAKSLFVFDMEGKFIRKIGHIGNGLGEYLEPNDFTLDTENRIIYLCDLRNRIHKYNLDGSYVSTITIDASDSKAIFIQYYNGSLYSSQIWWNQSEDDFLLLEIDPIDGKILSHSLPLKYNKGWNELFFDSYSRFFMSRTNNPPRYNQMFMDYIVSIEDEIKPYIELKSRYLTTGWDVGNFRGKDGIPANMANILNSSKKFNVHCFIENEDFINFRWGFGSSLAVIFNKETEEVKLADYLSNDLIYKNDQNGEFILFKFADANGAYVILDTQQRMLDDFQNSIKNNEIVPNLDKLEQLKQLTEDSNPAIFFYEFK